MYYQQARRQTGKICDNIDQYSLSHTHRSLRPQTNLSWIIYTFTMIYIEAIFIYFSQPNGLMFWLLLIFINFYWKFIVTLLLGYCNKGGFRAFGNEWQFLDLANLVKISPQNQKIGRQKTGGDRVSIQSSYMWSRADKNIHWNNILYRAKTLI